MSDIPWTHRKLPKRQSAKQLATDDIIKSPKTRRKCYVTKKEPMSVGIMLYLRDIETGDNHAYLAKRSQLFTVYI